MPKKKYYGNTKKTTEQFIEEAKKVHGDKYDYSKVEYINNHTNVCIICPEHGEFYQTPQHHINRKHGCPKCVKISTKIKHTLGIESFIKKSKQIHGSKYDYSKVEYVNSKTKVCVICPEHGEFFQTPSVHLRGCGCPKCAHEEHSNRMKGRGLKYTKEICFKISKQCSSRYEFQKLNQQAYYVSRINGWLDEMTHFETPKRYKPIEYIKNNIIYVYEFPNHVAYIGRTNNLKKRHKEHKRIHKHSNGKISISQVLKYSQDNSLPIPEPHILHSNLTLQESRILEDEMCQKYQQDGYRLLNVGKTGPYSGSIGAALLYDNYDEILLKAKTCKCRSEFRKNFGGMYNAARRMGIYEKIANECGWKKNKSEKTVLCFTNKKVYVGEFKNARVASNATGVDYRLISSNCNGKIKQTKGFIFTFKKSI